MQDYVTAYSPFRITDNGEQVAKRPHIRRAHWHGYWAGPRKPKLDMPEDQQQRRFFYHWLHPMIVGGKEDV